MDLYDAMGKRYSCRTFAQGDVEPEKVERILEAARIAPSARNFQDWRFIVVRDAQTRGRLCDCAKGQKFVAEAPVVIVAVGTNIEYRMTCGHHTFVIDVAIAGEHLALAATAEGLGTCWIGAFHEDQVRATLDIPDDCRVVVMFSLGYPARDDVPEKSRLAIGEIVYHEKWGDARA